MQGRVAVSRNPAQVGRVESEVSFGKITFEHDGPGEHEPALLFPSRQQAFDPLVGGRFAA